MLPQFKPMGKGFTGWNSPMSSAQSSAYGSSGLLPGNSRSAPMGAFAPLSDAGGGYEIGAPDAPAAGAPTGPTEPSGPSANTGPSGFGFSGMSGADMVGGLGSMAASALGAGGFAGPMGAAAGFAAGNNADKSIGQAIGSGIGFAFGGPIGSGIFGYLGGKFGSGEWGFEGKGQFDPSAPDNMGRVGSGLNADNTPNNAPGPAPGLGLGVDPGVTTGPLGPPDAPGPGLDPPGPGPALGPEPDVSVSELAAPWQDPDAPSTAPDAPAWNDPDAPSNDGGGGGDGGGGCVVCTTLHDHRLVEPIIYRAITAYGAIVNDNTMRGYHWWGKPLARLLDRSALARWLISPLARPVVRELAFRGGIGKSTWLGRRLLGLGEIACAAVATLLTPKQGSCENCKCRLN